ncbi:MAG: hypothetical protein E6J24_14625 [Chloroflexi bacterium]|nr:MAG: hypothetical protein E6J24_14625 [Chloroflexota bacterium]
MNESLRAVCVGGGLGAPTVMAGLRTHTPDITGLIAVTDSGRSTGKVRIALDVPAPGDIRNALTVLAEGDPVLTRLMAHRFDTEKSEELIPARGRGGVAASQTARARPPGDPLQHAPLR